MYTRIGGIRALGLGILSLSFFIVPGLANAEGPGLILEPPEPGKVLAEPIPALKDFEVWRYREVTIDLDVLLAAAAPLSPDPSVNLNLFDDANYVADFLAMEGHDAAGLETWTGLVKGWMGPGTAVFVIDPEKGLQVGGVRVDGDLYRLEFDERTNGFLLAQINPDVRPGGIPDCGGTIFPEADELVGAGSLDQATAPLAALSETNVVSLLVVIDQASAANDVGLRTAVYAIGEANVIFAAQGNPTRLWDVRFVNSDYAATGDLHADLDWLETSDYATDDRGTADLVMLLVDDGQFCGLARTGDGRPRKNSAFTSVVVRICADTNLTLLHELGHNFSACHDKYVEGNNCMGGFADYRHGYVLTWWDSPNPLPPWPCGWYRPHPYCSGHGVRDVMAYSDYCRDNGFICPRVPVLSDPDLFWAIPAGSPLPPRPIRSRFGSADLADVNSVIEFTSSFVKDYR